MLLSPSLSASCFIHSLPVALDRGRACAILSVLCPRCITGAGEGDHDDGKMQMAWQSAQPPTDPQFGQRG